MRVLIIDIEQMGLDFALRCAEAGHEVRLFRHMPKKPVRYGEGFKSITLVDAWQASMPWAREGVIVITGNYVLIHEMDRYRELGYRIFGPTVKSARLEIDRMAGMGAMRAAGIDVPECHVFASLQEAYRFAKKEDRAFVFKPAGDEDNKAMTYVADDQEDLVGWLGRQIEAGKAVKQCFLQEKVDVLAEIGVSGWMGPEGFLPDRWNTCFEHKRLMSGEIGPNCYSADTEVLTEGGWKFWPAVTEDDRIATLVDGYLTYEKPLALVAAPFDGEMISWASSRVDILVTPGHQMYVADRDTIRAGDPNFFLAPADQLARNVIEKKFAVLRVARWLPSLNPEAEQYTPAWARLLGMYLADGYCRERSIVFGNCPAHKEKLIRAAALACNYVAHRYGADVYINSRDLANQWRDYPKATEKRAPLAIMDGTPEIIAAFLDGLSLDATTRRGNLTYTTSSKRMADDIQIMLLRVGLSGQIRERDRRGEPDRLLQGYVIKGSLSWDVGVSSNALAWLRPKYCHRLPYRGVVYCATVSSHVMMVRRNGKACWNGNTGEAGTICQYTEDDKLADELLKPMEPILRTLGHRGDFAVGAIIDTSGKAWPLEFTARCGYPAWWIQTASHRGDPAKWMRDLLDGKDSLRVSYDAAIGVVVGIPRYPYNASPPELVEGHPIIGYGDVSSNLHLASAMCAKGVVQTTGEYVMVATALGKTVERARRRVYDTLKGVRVADMIYRDDIGEKVIDALPALRRHGYALTLE